MHERPHEKLVVWKESYALFLWVQGLLKQFPSEERYALTEQMRKASYSVPLNIAEGNARRTLKDKRRFLDMAMGSLEELHCQSRIAKDLGYISFDQFQKTDEHISRVSYLLHRLRSSLF